MHARITRNRLVEYALGWMDHRIRAMAAGVMSSLESRYESQCPPFIRVAYRNQLLEPDEIVRDVLGGVIREGQGPALGVLLVFDPWPHANWGHACWVAGLDAARDSGTDWIEEREFPPNENDLFHLVPCATYHKDGKLERYYPPNPTPECSPAG